jgi:membrane protein required for colicin V production
MEYSAIDIVFLVVIIFFTLRAAIRGFVKELLSTASVVVGIAAAVAFSGLVAQAITPYVGSLVWSQIIGFLGIFILVYLFMKLFENGLHRLVERINLESLDHALGIFLGIVEGVLVVFILVLLIQIQPFVEPQALLADSWFAQMLTPFLPYASELLNRRATDV